MSGVYVCECMKMVEYVCYLYICMYMKWRDSEGSYAIPHQGVWRGKLRSRGDSALLKLSARDTEVEGSSARAVVGIKFIGVALINI